MQQERTVIGSGARSNEVFRSIVLMSLGNVVQIRIIAGQHCSPHLLLCSRFRSVASYLQTSSTSRKKVKGKMELGMDGKENFGKGWLGEFLKWKYIIRGWKIAS